MVKSFPLLLFLSLISAFFSYSQNINSKISGKIFNTEKDQSAVNILLITAKDSVMVKSILGNEDGSFEITNVKPNNYLLFIQKLGYQNTYSKIIVVNSNSSIIEPPIEIIKQSRLLKEVIIQSKIPYIERRAGKTIINVENSVFGLGSSGFEILQTIPGIRLDNNGQLSIQGNSNVGVFIDGKPSNLIGKDLTEFLKNLPTNNIEKIELLNTASAKYDASVNGGVINIKFKKGKNIGSNGTVSFGSGIGRNYRYNSGINLNNRTAKSNIYINYDYSRIKAIDDNYINRNVINNNNTTLFNITNNDLKTRTNQNFLVGFDYTLNKNHSIGFLANAFSNKMLSDENNTSLIFNNTIKDSTVLSTSLENRKINNLSTNINYSGIIGKKGTSIKADIDFLNYDRKSNEQLISKYLNKTNNEFKPQLIFDNLSPSQITILSAKSDLSYPIYENATLDFGAKTSWVNTSSNRKINIISGQNYIINPSTLFKYEENIFAGYLSFRTKIKKGNLELGLRAEKTIAKGDTTTKSKLVDKNYLNLFPNISYELDLNPNHKLSFSFNRGINRPRYEDLNPFFYFLDQYTYNQGNPSLLPSYTNSSKINWAIKSKYVFSLNYNYIKDFIYTVYEQNNITKTAVTNNQNFDYQQTLGFNIGVPVTITSWWNSDINLESNYEFFRYTNNLSNKINNESTSFLADFNHTLSLPKEFNAMINMHYESSTSYGIYRFKPLYYLNFGFSKSILKKQGSIRLLATDLFDNNSNRYATNFYNLDLNAKEKTETRSFRLSFSYKFGKKDVKTYRKRKVGADEEKLRVGQ